MDVERAFVWMKLWADDWEDQSTEELVLMEEIEEWEREGRGQTDDDVKPVKVVEVSIIECADPSRLSRDELER